MNLLDSSSSEEDDTRIQIRRRKVFRERINFNLDARLFLERFRISHQTADCILNAIGRHIQHRTNRNNALSPREQLLVALHFFGNGAQYHGVSDMHGVHKSTVCRAVRRVTCAIIRYLFGVIVRWPNNASTYSIPIGFEQIAGFPNVAGAVDGTLIPIESPKDDENAYVDRHGQHSLTVMLVCGPSHQFYYVSARWPGSVHDNRVLRNSSLFRKWEIEGWRPFPNAILIGDSGYGMLSWLWTPNIPPNTPAEDAENYLRRHRSTRQTIECAIGRLKAKFPCLRYLRLKTPARCCEVILACVVLYNIQNRIKSYRNVQYPNTRNPNLQM